MRTRGRFGNGIRTRTIPPTPAVVPYDLHPTDHVAEVLSTVKPLSAELEREIQDPPFDAWPFYRQVRPPP